MGQAEVWKGARVFSKVVKHDAAVMDHSSNSLDKNDPS